MFGTLFRLRSHNAQNIFLCVVIGLFYFLEFSLFISLSSLFPFWVFCSCFSLWHIFLQTKGQAYENDSLSGTTLALFISLFCCFSPCIWWSLCWIFLKICVVSQLHQLIQTLALSLVFSVAVSPAVPLSWTSWHTIFILFFLSVPLSLFISLSCL